MDAQLAAQANAANRSKFLNEPNHNLGLADFS